MPLVRLAAEDLSDADYNLAVRQADWRRECAAFARDYIASSDDAVTDGELRAALLRECDAQTADWLMSEYKGLRMLPFGADSWIVEVSEHAT